MEKPIVKMPHECCSKEDVRKEIDRIDHEILNLFAMRFEYVKAIVQFKTDKESVVALERKEKVIHQRALWAKALGLDEATFGSIYRTLVDSNIEKEMELLKKKMQ